MPPEGAGRDGTTADPLAEATREVADIAWRLPDGRSRVFHEHRPYALTVARVAGGRSLKLYAEALDGRDVVSANLYRGATRMHVRPCEMSMEKVRRFLVGMRPAASGSDIPPSGTPAGASSGTPAGDQGAAPAPISGKA